MPLLGYIKNNKKVTNAYYLDIIGTPITYQDFMQLTPAQQENGNWYVTGMSPMINAYSIMYKNGLSIGQALDAGASDMTGATASADGTHGLVPAPQAGDEYKVLKGDGTWGTAGDTATVRYNEETGYIQCKDSEGWFNWKLASRQLVDQIPIMTGNSSPKGLCTASNSLACSPFQAFNRTSSNYWKPTQGTTGWVDYEFEEVAEIVKVLIVAGGTSDGMTVIANHSLSIQYSMDGLVYNTIATLNNSLKNLNYEFDSPIQMKHLRIVYHSCNALHQGQYRYTAVDYIEAFGH